MVQKCHNKKGKKFGKCFQFMFIDMVIDNMIILINRNLVLHHEVNLRIFYEGYYARKKRHCKTRTFAKLLIWQNVINLGTVS